MRVKIMIFNIFSFVQKILHFFKNLLENLINYLKDNILYHIFEILSVLILSPLLIIFTILGFVYYLIELLNNKTFYFLPSKLRIFVKRQQKIIKNQENRIKYLEKKLKGVGND